MSMASQYRRAVPSTDSRWKCPWQLKLVSVGPSAFAYEFTGVQLFDPGGVSMKPTRKAEKCCSDVLRRQDVVSPYPLQWYRGYNGTMMMLISQFVLQSVTMGKRQGYNQIQ